MDWLPLCKICGERHRLGFCPDLDPLENQRVQTAPIRCENPVLNGQGPQAAASIRSSGEPSPAQGENNETQAPGPQETRPAVAAQDQGRAHEPHSKKKFDKRAYQRDLMRKRRAEGKAK